MDGMIKASGRALAFKPDGVLSMAKINEAALLMLSKSDAWYIYLVQYGILPGAFFPGLPNVLMPSDLPSLITSRHLASLEAAHVNRLVVQQEHNKMTKAHENAEQLFNIDAEIQRLKTDRENISDDLEVAVDTALAKLDKNAEEIEDESKANDDKLKHEFKKLHSTRHTSTLSSSSSTATLIDPRDSQILLILRE